MAGPMASLAFGNSLFTAWAMMWEDVCLYIFFPSTFSKVNTVKVPS